MMLWDSTDGGRTWRRHFEHGNFGHYGKLHLWFLTLCDGQVLLNFTVHSNATDGYGLGLGPLPATTMAEHGTWTTIAS